MRSRKVATARHCRRGPACAYPAIRDGWPGRPPPVIRETSQFHAQNDSLSLSPAHDGISLHLNFRVLAAFSLGRPIFPPSFTLERISADHLPQSSSASRFTVGAAGFSCSYEQRPFPSSVV